MCKGNTHLRLLDGAADGLFGLTSSAGANKTNPPPEYLPHEADDMEWTSCQPHRAAADYINAPFTMKIEIIAVRYKGIGRSLGLPLWTGWGDKGGYPPLILSIVLEVGNCPQT